MIRITRLIGNGVPDPLAHLPVEDALGLSG